MQRIKVRYSVVALLMLFSIFGSAMTPARVSAQRGTTDATASRSQYLADAGIIPAADNIVVEEMINYHHHHLTSPQSGEAVALDVRWGNPLMYQSYPEAILQVGFTTHMVASKRRSQLRPLNLALVIDCSGSMAESDKLIRVKEALITMIAQLRDIDIVSIITYSSGAAVLWPAQPLHNRLALQQAIATLTPDGSTNLHAGLMLGYKEASKYFHKDTTNRVILLTDGIANTGVVDPNRILGDSLNFVNRGIDLATIGVGLNLNEDLLRRLAREGRGLYHFVADAKDIKKVFVKELESLLSPVARDVLLEITYDGDLTLEHLFGYRPKFTNNKLTLALDDMNNGLTQVVIMKFGLKNRRSAKLRLPVKVELSYFDIDENKTVVKTNESFVTLTADRPVASIDGGKPTTVSNNGHNSNNGSYFDSEMEVEIAKTNQGVTVANGISPDDIVKIKQVRDKFAVSYLDILKDDEVRKNYTIACLAQTMREMAHFWEKRSFVAAQYLVDTAVNETVILSPVQADKDVTYVLDIVRKYQDAMTKFNQQPRTF
ncbi:MAG: VWA domain-containing protein [Acidobacteriota bacterium]